MNARTKWTALWPAALAAWLLGCSGFGRVEQGRTVAYDPERGLVTLILDSNPGEPGKPRYDRLPPATFRVPSDRSQMGPAPRAGMLLSIDAAEGRALVFDAASQGVRTVPFTVVERRDGVAADDPRVASVRLPKVDRAANTITLYAPRQGRLLTVSVAPEYLALPDNTWAWGDEVRYYYKDPGQALRLMNVTRTDVTKGK
jgi:hypothetical protein